MAPSLDTEPIRLHLLHLLEELFTSGAMPAGHRSRNLEFLGKAIIQQLAEFKELRAIPLLRQIAGLDGAPPSQQGVSSDSKVAISHMHLAETAQQALRELEE